MNLERFTWVLKTGLFLSIAIVVFAAAMGFGIVERQLTVVGPFKAESESTKSHALVVDLRPALPMRGAFSSGGDSLYSPNQSSLQLQVNGVPLDLHHSMHETIRWEGGGAFSHWGNDLIFSLPNGVGNTESTRLDVRFALRLHPRAVSAGFLLGVISGFLLLKQFRRRNLAAYELQVSRALMMLGYLLQVIFALGLLAAIIFLGSTIAGCWAGLALPATAFFRWWPGLNGLALQEPAFGHVILIIAMIGAGAAWLASTTGQHASAFALVEAKLAAGFLRFGWMFLVGLFLYSVGATWSGIPRPQDLGGNAIAGLLPFSDAKGHFEQVYSQALQGNWQSFVARRPLAASFRTVAVAAVDYNNFHFLLLQTAALALATFFAARAVVNWRGIWAGLTFLGLVHILVRPYLPTNLTEPLGIFWALVAIPFLIRAIRHSRLSDTATGFHLTVWALMTRMGSMFTLPALGLWAVLSQWGDRRKTIRAALVIVALLLLNAAFITGLAKLYGTTSGATGSNFSHTLCGLTHGTDWTGCGRIYADEFDSLSSEAEQARLYYSKALEQFVAEPLVLFARLWQGELKFLGGIFNRLLTGYTGSVPDAFPTSIWWLAALAGVGLTMRQRREKHEPLFWLLFVLSLLASAPFVMFDDGWRVLSASFPLLAVLIAAGFSGPVSRPIVPDAPPGRAANWRHYTVLTTVAVLCLAVPGAVHRLDWLGQNRISFQASAPDQAVFLGTRHMSGFLVVPDGEPLPAQVPAIHQADFVKIIRFSSIEQYEPLVTPTPVHQPPFALVSAIAVDGKSHGLLVLPAHVFVVLDDHPWLFRLAPGNYWRRVTEAKPLAQ